MLKCTHVQCEYLTDANKILFLLVTYFLASFRFLNFSSIPFSFFELSFGRLRRSSVTCAFPDVTNVFSETCIVQYMFNMFINQNNNKRLFGCPIFYRSTFYATMKDELNLQRLNPYSQCWIQKSFMAGIVRERSLPAVMKYNFGIGIPESLWFCSD